MSAAVAGVLNRAADIIERNGWVQGRYHLPTPATSADNCPVCAVGAISIALHGWVPPREGPHASTWDVARVVAGFLEADHLPDWNDEAGRTAEEVVTALRGAAQVEREPTA